MFDPTTERWPPTYDAEELAQQILALAGSEAIAEDFYVKPKSTAADADVPPWCQGDVIHLDCDVPLIDEDGEPGAVESDAKWLLIGNTCDTTRDIATVRYTQLVPLVDLGSSVDIGKNELSSLRRYNQFRSFYVPPWTSTGHHFAADFLRPVALDRAALGGAKRLARLSFRSWILLHSCLVRFFARDDGRHEADK